MQRGKNLRIFNLANGGKFSEQVITRLITTVLIQSRPDIATQLLPSTCIKLQEQVGPLSQAIRVAKI